MQLGTVGAYSVTIGWVIGLLVAIVAVLGLLGVIPNSPQIVFACLAALGIARLV